MLIVACQRSMWSLHKSHVPWVIYTTRIMAFINPLYLYDKENPVLTLSKRKALQKTALSKFFKRVSHLPKTDFHFRRIAKHFFQLHSPMMLAGQK